MTTEQKIAAANAEYEFCVSEVINTDADAEECAKEIAEKFGLSWKFRDFDLDVVFSA